MNPSFSIQKRLQRLVITLIVLLLVILISALVMMVVSNSHYTQLLHNVSTASEFNQAFKSNIDQKMYYYVIESQYSEGLPIEEVRAAQDLAKSLIDTTTQKDSRQAISSVLDLCENLEEKIYQIQNTANYDDRLAQLENNVYVLTSLVQEYMYTYLYYEAVELNALQQEVSGQIITEIIVIIMVCTIAIIFVLRYSIRLSRSITDPLVELSRRAESVRAGDLTPHEPVPSQVREIQTLSDGMEQMITRLNEQMQESQKKQESLRRTELALLQAQINPHFLYNTMDTIIWLIEAEKTAEAVNMVSNLSGFFRHSLSSGKDVITLAEEQQHVESYLQIQQARYKDILTYTIQIDPALHDVLVPKLTLQPLVENALYHGIKLKRSMGHIQINGWMENGTVFLEVSDNGIGITQEKLRQLRQTMDDEKKIGFGFSAVNQRLRLQFGPEYGLSIVSREGIGTIVTVRMPYTEKEVLQ